MHIPSDQNIQSAFKDINKLEKIDKGGFKVVYKANINGKWEAFKLIEIPTLTDYSHEESVAIRHELRGRIFREIGILQKIVVPELVRLGTITQIEANIEGRDYICYSEEFIEGRDLWKEMKMEQSKPPEKELRHLFSTIIKAIQLLWNEGFIHRDIKPKNIMKTTSSSRPFILMDLGIAYSIHETALTYNAFDRLPPATYRYIAPEMLNPNFRESLDFRSDLYSAALSVYEYAAKRHPLARDDDDLIQTLSRAVRQPPVPLSKYRPDLSPQLCNIVDQMLKKKPALRFSNMKSLIIQLEGKL